jgi:hypothetical protein
MKKGNIFSQEKVETVIFIKREKNCSYRQHKRKEKKRRESIFASFCLQFLFEVWLLCSFPEQQNSLFEKTFFLPKV